MLDIVAAHDDQLALAVEIEGVHDVEALGAIAAARNADAPPKQHSYNVEGEQDRDQKGREREHRREKLHLHDAG